MHAQGIPVDFIREQLGHASLATTFQYLFNPLTEEESYQMLTDAASNVVSIAEFRDRKPAVPKFSNAKK